MAEKKCNCPGGTNPIAVRGTRAKFCHERIKDPKKFDPKSFRTKVYRAHRITFGCPKGKYSKGVCKVPVQVQAILHPVGEAKCPTPGAMIKKNPFLETSLAIATGITVGELGKSAVKKSGILKNPKGIIAPEYKIAREYRKIARKLIKDYGGMLPMRGVLDRLNQIIFETGSIGTADIKFIKNLKSRFYKKLNPGAKWHEDEEIYYDKMESQMGRTKDTGAGQYFRGQKMAHRESKQVARKMGMNPKTEDDIKNADLFIKRFLKGELLNYLIDEFKRVNAVTAGFLSELKRRLRPSDYKLISRRIGTGYVKWKRSLKNPKMGMNPKDQAKKELIEYIKSLRKKYGLTSPIYSVEDFITKKEMKKLKLFEEKFFRPIFHSKSKKKNPKSSALALAAATNPMYIGRAKLEAAALKLYKLGWGVDSVIMELKKKFDVPSSVAEYIAKQAARISRGEIKDNPVGKGRELIDKYLALDRRKSSNETKERQIRQGILVSPGIPLTKEEIMFHKIAGELYEKYTTRAIMESEGIYLVKIVGKGKKAKEEWKSLDELRNEYNLFRGKSEEEMRDVVDTYRKKADVLRLQSFNKLAETNKVDYKDIEHMKDNPKAKCPSKNALDDTVYIKKGASVQRMIKGKPATWAKTNKRVKANVVYKKYGVFTVSILGKFYKVDYKNVEHMNDNPVKGATKIYDRILSIEAKKGKNSNFPNENFRHDFSSKDAEILGMPDGSLKIRSKTGKKLWKNFNYPEKGKK